MGYSSLLVSLYILMQKVCSCIHLHAYLCDLIYMLILNKWCLSKAEEETQLTRNCCYKNTASWFLSILIFIKQNSESRDVIELWFFFYHQIKNILLWKSQTFFEMIFTSFRIDVRPSRFSLLNSERFSIVNKCQIALTYRFLFPCLAD